MLIASNKQEKGFVLKKQVVTQNKFCPGYKILIALSFNQYILLKFHLFTLMFFAKHLIIERLTNIDFYYNT